MTKTTVSKSMSKAEIRRENNRQAAKRSRDRKKALLKSLQEENREKDIQIQQLKSQLEAVLSKNQSLETENIFLNSKIFELNDTTQTQVIEPIFSNEGSILEENTILEHSPSLEKEDALNASPRRAWSPRFSFGTMSPDIENVSTPPNSPSFR